MLAVLGSSNMFQKSLAQGPAPITTCSQSIVPLTVSTPVTALLAAASKAMGFVALFKVFIFTLEPFSEEWRLILGILALASMTIGNLAALSQKDIGRMLAYSSIAQAGYILIAFPALTHEAISGAIAHTMVHAFMKGGAFIIVAGVGAAGLGYNLSSFKGLAQRSQLLALSMTVCLLSLVGLPPLAGFISKFLLFYGVLQVGVGGETWIIALVVAGVLNSALSLYYYLKVIRFMYLYDPEDLDDVLKKFIVSILKKAASKTGNKVDDLLVAQLEKALFES